MTTLPSSLDLRDHVECEPDAHAVVTVRPTATTLDPETYDPEDILRATTEETRVKASFRTLPQSAPMDA